MASDILRFVPTLNLRGCEHKPRYTTLFRGKHNDPPRNTFSHEAVSASLEQVELTQTKERTTAQMRLAEKAALRRGRDRPSCSISYSGFWTTAERRGPANQTWLAPRVSYPQNISWGILLHFAPKMLNYENYVGTDGLRDRVNTCCYQILSLAQIYSPKGELPWAFLTPCLAAGTQRFAFQGCLPPSGRASDW